MKTTVAVLFLVGSLMVYWHWVLGVLVLVAAAWAVPFVVRDIHDQLANRHHLPRGPKCLELNRPLGGRYAPINPPETAPEDVTSAD